MNKKTVFILMLALAITICIFFVIMINKKKNRVEETVNTNIINIDNSIADDKENDMMPPGFSRENMDVSELEEFK